MNRRRAENSARPDPLHRTHRVNSRVSNYDALIERALPHFWFVSSVAKSRDGVGVAECLPLSASGGFCYSAAAAGEGFARPQIDFRRNRRNANANAKNGEQLALARNSRADDLKWIM